MTALAEEKDLYRAAFDRFAAERPAEPAWLRDLRAAAIERFTESGFPTTRDEDWRHTSVAPIARTAFALAPEAAGRTMDASGLLPGPRVVFVNGRHMAALSTPAGDLPEGVEVLSLRDALGRDPGRLEPYLGRIAGPGNAFAALNAAFLEEGAVVLVAPGAAVEEALQLVFTGTSPENRPVASFPRTLIRAGRGSQARIVETYAGAGGDVYLTCAVTEVVVEENARLDHYKVQQDGDAAFHVATLAARVERSGRLADHAFSLGAALSRNDIQVLLAGEGGECELDGLFLAGGSRQTDTHTLIDHAVPHCASRELYKGVLDGRARGVFHGRIVVREGAQKTDAYQTNKNLLLSKEALVNSTPQLEIFADDVKCKHGSTTGQLDPAALFYLRSRGIAEAAARSLLTYAFASDVVSRIRVAPLRVALERHLQKQLPGALETKEAVV